MSVLTGHQCVLVVYAAVVYACVVVSAQDGKDSDTVAAGVLSQVLQSWQYTVRRCASPLE